MLHLFFILFLVMAGSAKLSLAQSNLPPCPTDQNVRYDNCYGQITMPNREKYVGEFKGGKKNGQGTFTAPNGDKWVGEFTADRLNGQATFTSRDGDKYVGGYKDGDKNGQGTYTYPDGGKYVGEFKDGKKNGQGTFTAPNGDKWAGEFAAGQLNGQATFISHDGTKYVGGYKDGDKNGQGTYTWSNGDQYIGQFRDGEMNGQGVLSLRNGDRYVGEFGSQGPNGHATFISHDGTNYVGGYKGGDKNGQGIYTWPSGKKYVGDFRNGVSEGRGILFSADGSVVQSGIWKKDKLIKSTKPDPTLVALAAKDIQSNSKNVENNQQINNAQGNPPAVVQQSPAVANSSLRRVALIIANGNYSSAPPLPNPINDANLLANSLKTAGFQYVTIKLDQNHEALLSSIKEFAKAADGSDWAFIYYSGHGIAFNGINYMIPVDAKLKADRDIQLEAVDVNAVVAALDGAKKIRVVVLDMCRSNPFVGGMKRSLASRSLGRGLAPIEPEAGVLTVFAAKDGQEALDGEGNNSPFAEALAKRILTPNLEIRRLFDMVRDDVLAATQKKQMPFSYGSVSGSEDFYFVQKP